MHNLDCLILGFYDYPFDEYVAMLRAMGDASGAYQDVALALVEHEGRPMRALDVFTRFYNEGRPGPPRLFHNADFLWPVVAYLTTYLRRRGLDVDYVNLPHLEREKLRDRLSAGARSVAITTTLYVSPHPILALVGEIRDVDGDVPIVVGGPYITNQARTLERPDLTALFDYLGADIYVLCQDGEATLARLVEALRGGRSLDTVPNLAFRRADGTFTFTMPCPESNDLAENIIDYRPFLADGPQEFLSIRTARSCPFACAFCGFPERAGAYQFLDVASVERQLNAAADAGVRTLTLLDDTFNVPKGRFKDLLRMMIRNRYGFRWNCFYRADMGDAEAIGLMGESGCEGVFLGVESGSDRMLEGMNKTARKRHYAEAIPRLHAAGISTYASLIIGFPGETADTVRETAEFIEDAQPDYYRAQLWYADPLTPVWKQRDRWAIEGEGFTWSHATMTTREACEWIDRLFVDVRNSEWLPQFGFEQWSTFYLARHGMTRRQIRAFVGAFNAVIRHRLTSDGAPTPAGLLAALRATCQFDRPDDAREAPPSAAVAGISPQTIA